RDHINSFLTEYRSKQGIASELDDGRYGLAILCANKQQLAEVRDELERGGFFGRLRLAVGIGPTAETYADMLNEHRVVACADG
ncbi:MAG: hypothetical protein AAFX06_32880, partial [Planctomycetota bacterium]